MEKILVTTDLSANSRSAVRFAIQLAKQRKVELVFLHVHQVLRASTWTDGEYLNYVNKIEKNLLSDLSAFIKQTYRSMKVTPGSHKLIVYQYIRAVDGIMQFAKDNRCSYICIGTRGAGRVRKVFGTTAGRLITESETPVLCIPHNYRTRPISKLLYASDMQDYEPELKEIVSFAKPIKTSVELLHLAYPYEHITNKKIVEPALKKRLKYPVQLHYEQRDIERSLLQQIDKAITKARPSVLVMFTQQERSLFERLFLSSKTREYSFNTRIPMLIFRKATS